MQALIKEIKLQNENYSFINDIDSQGKWLKFLSKINIFVGENNSGKSRLLRSLLSNKLDYVSTSSFIEDYNNYVESFKKEFDSYFLKNDIDVNGFINICKTLDDIHKIEYIDSSSNLYEKFSKLKQAIEQIKNAENHFSGRKSHSDIAKKLNQILDEKEKIIKGNFENCLKPTEFKKIYIPILRGLKPVLFEENKFKYDDVYNRRTRKDYFNDDSEISNSIEIFTGIQSYTEIKSHLLGKLYHRKLIDEYESFLSEYFFDGKRVTLIPSLFDDLLTIKLGEEMERPIYEMGDGIQSIIILTLPLFIYKGKNLLVFIEEPEKLLHPGLQRKLIESLLKQKEFENCQYFMTTHSNHFLDITLDITLDFPEISIYALTKKFPEKDGDEKEPQFFIENLKHGDTSALDLLGVQNSSVFLSNCTIWVEGITDRLYFRCYLGLYFDYLRKINNPVKFKEDFHYSFVEYSGGNITHWSFLDNEKYPMNVKRLCGKLFLINDRDIGKDERHKKLKESLGDRFCPLECLEVENLISKKVIQKIINDYEGDNLELNFEEIDYKNEKLGKFIDEKLGAKKRRSYSAESGTVSDKLNFCKKAIKFTNDWDDLSEEAKSICKKICRFINENNGCEVNLEIFS